MAKRKEIESFIIKHMNMMDKSGKNGKLYEAFFKSMSNEAFNEFREDLKNGKYYLTIISPVGDSDVKLSVENNLTVAKKIGLELFKHVKLVADDGSLYLSPMKMLVYPLNVRRAAQHLTKGISTQEHSKSRNSLTQQVTGNSKSGKITLPEINVLTSLKLEKTLTELMGARGGDLKAKNAMVAFITRYGEVKQSDLDRFAGTSGSTKTLKNIFKALHIDITI